MNIWGYLYTIGCIVLAIVSYAQNSLFGVAIAIILLLLLHA